MRLFQLIILLACGFQLLAQPFNLIRNGDFSKGRSDFTSDYVYDESPLLDEKKCRVSNDPHSTFAFFAACTDHSASHGNMLVVNGSTKKNDKVWEQTVQVKAQTNYTFSVWVCTVNIKRKEEASAHPTVLQVYINGEPVGLVFAADENACRWVQLTASWHSGAMEQATIYLVDQNVLPNGNDFALDDCSLYEYVPKEFSLRLEKRKAGEPVALKNILFEEDSYSLKADSFRELDKLVAYLNAYPNLKVEISGHTDNIGKESDNLILSVNRAKEIGKYCLSKGIAASRITTKGYGSRRPVDTNDTVWGRENNRRVQLIFSPVKV